MDNYVEELLKAAEAGDASAQYQLAFCFAKGRGVEKDDEAAVAWFQKAAATGNVGAQFHLAGRYAYGVGVTKSEAEALRLYSLAAAGGDTQAAKALRLIGITNPGFNFFILTLLTFAAAFVASALACTTGLR